MHDSQRYHLTGIMQQRERRKLTESTRFKKNDDIFLLVAQIKG